MTNNKNPWVLSRVPDHLQIATGKEMLDEIRKLRETEFTKHYSGEINFYDVFDDHACVLSSANDDGEVVSTGRVVFDEEVGLPADELIKTELDKLRQQGLKIAEPSKFAIAREARGMLPSYMLTYYEIAKEEGIDSLVFICKEKSVKFYKKVVGAKVLCEDIGYSYGTRSRFVLLEWKVKASRPYLSNWLKEEIS